MLQIPKYHKVDVLRCPGQHWKNRLSLWVNIVSLRRSLKPGNYSRETKSVIKTVIIAVPARFSKNRLCQRPIMGKNRFVSCMT